MEYMRNGKHVAKYLDPIGRMTTSSSLRLMPSLIKICPPGNLANIKQTYPVPLPEIIKYWSPELSDEEIDQFADFIGLMLQFHPKDRNTARQMLNHVWLQT